MTTQPRVLIVDDEPQQQLLLQTMLSDAGYGVAAVSSGREALQMLAEPSSDFQLVVTDLTMPGMTGVELIQQARLKSPELEFIVVTAHGSIESAIAALRAGAYDYLQKPIELDELLLRIEKLLTLKEAQEKAENLERENKSLRGVDQLVAESRVMRSLLAELDRVSQTDASVLFMGETGVGKEVLSRYVHEHSLRAKAPFIAVNCSAIPENLMESEFFGFEKGAFTGADRRNVGFFERASKGTLFLDEIGELDLKLQPKILRAIEERKVRRVAGAADIPVDVRFLAATNRDLKQLVVEKRFRDDLYYRLNVVTIRIPPLRERREDIPGLVRHLVRRHATRLKAKVSEIGSDYIELLQGYSFPGNVRELSNLIERSIIYQLDGKLSAASLPGDLWEHSVSQPDAPTPSAGEGESLASLVGSYEKNVIAQQLQTMKGDVDQVAARLKIPRSTLYSKISKYGIK